MLVVSWLAVLWMQAPRLADPFRVDEDFRSFYWMHKFRNPALFPDQFDGYAVVRLFGRPVPLTFASPGYSLLFYAVRFVFDPIPFSKLLPFLLMPPTVMLLFAFGRDARHRRAGWTLALGFLFLNLASSSAVSIANGLQRSFACPFAIALLYFLHARRYRPAAVTLFLSATVYAPAFALGAALWGFHFLRANGWLTRRPSLRRGGGLLLLAAGFFGAMALLPALSPALAARLSERPPPLPPAGTTTLYRRAWDNPIYRPGGSVPLFVLFPIVGRGGLVDLGEDLVNWLILLLVGGLIALVRRRNAFALPAEGWDMLAASGLMFGLAWLAAGTTGAWTLYYPSRYTRVGVYLFLQVWVLLNLTDFVREAPAFLLHRPRRLVGLVVGLECVALGLLAAYPNRLATIRGLNMKWLLGAMALAFGGLGVAVARRMPSWRQTPSGDSHPRARRALLAAATALGVLGWAVYAPIFTNVSYLKPSPDERALFAFARTLPPDVRFAGWPCLLDDIPLFGERQILFGCEEYQQGELAVDALTAYYADDPAALVAFCRRRGVTHLVADRQTFTPSFLARGEFFFEPYNSQIRAQIAGRRTFALLNVPPEAIPFRAGNLFVVPCDALAAAR
ncbi:MAG: hypothetical protein D6796_06335 [Caldilineae bacterium]|nr:MAG: hypothetical protein D6796_06335 [Caldilineae bacterium]